MSIKHKGETVLQNFVKVPIASTINESSTNEECAGALATKIELDKKIDKTSIAITIDASSTNEQVVSAKSVYDAISDLIKIKKVLGNNYTVNKDVNTIDVSAYMENGYYIASAVIDNAGKKPLYISRIEQDGNIQFYNPNEQFTTYVSISIIMIKGKII